VASCLRTAQTPRKKRTVAVIRVSGRWEAMTRLFTMLNAAQAKLGRRDARLLIDVSTVAHQHARPYLPDELTKQIDQVLGQLRLSQVSAEGRASRPGEQEENDLDRVPAPPPAKTQSPGEAPGRP
jgi:hypothetical protein